MVVPHIVSNSDIDSIAQIVCFVVITLHFLGGLATLWCVFLLKAFTFLFEALGRPDIAGHIPSRLATVQSYSGIPSYHVTALLVCPACGDVFPVGYGAPVDCPRCSIPLYENLLKSTIIPFQTQCARPLSLPFASHSSPYLLSWRGYLAHLASNTTLTGDIPSNNKKVYIKIFQMAKFGVRYLTQRESSSSGVSTSMEGNVHQMQNCESELPLQWIGVCDISPCHIQLMHI